MERDTLVASLTEHSIGAYEFGRYFCRGCRGSLFYTHAQAAQHLADVIQGL
ncbi:hypothetical protein [Nocardia brasiliensis]|uniref:hypothetical protein n=1 Tax=Nocardia brasiliensis TaxID=37326 RepID=UPI002457CAD9|nr:hypothetical protein [Nocardia brasiliensis]